MALSEAKGMGADGRAGAGLEGQEKVLLKSEGEKLPGLSGKPQTAGYKMPSAEIFLFFLFFFFFN